ncbi:MAG TPA: response regulator transcription factor [Acidimicrobiales bacterium]|nr:response regulator transcription factor [Acidimicrobiales bacterium]
MGIRIVVVDGNTAVRQSIRELLEAEEDFEFVGEAATSEDTELLVEHSRPDVVVLDVRLPDGDGIDLCRTIRSLYPRIACVVLTAYADGEAVLASLLAGAAGYFLKQIRGGDLVSCIRTVSAGGQFLDNSLMGHSLATLGTGSKYGLDATEVALVRGILEGMSKQEIAAELSIPEDRVEELRSVCYEKVRPNRAP